MTGDIRVKQFSRFLNSVCFLSLKLDHISLRPSQEPKDLMCKNFLAIFHGSGDTSFFMFLYFNSVWQQCNDLYWKVQVFIL